MALPGFFYERNILHPIDINFAQIGQLVQEKMLVKEKFCITNGENFGANRSIGSRDKAKKVSTL